MNQTTSNSTIMTKNGTLGHFEADIHSWQDESAKEVIYTGLILITGATVRHASHVLSVPVPYTVVVFLVGIILGLLPAGEIVNMGPHTIIAIFIPVLIFEGSCFIDIYIFKEIFGQVLVLAVPGLIVMIFLTAVTTMYLFNIESWTWTHAFVIGSILSATDPVAVVAIMKELGASKHLSLLVEGESMLNDGTAMVMFDLFFGLLKESVEVTSYYILKTMLGIIWTSFGGPMFGFIMALLAVYWLQRTFNDSLTEITITLTMSYLTYYVAADMLKTSGVLAVVTFGVVVGDYKTCISPEVEVMLHSFWDTLSFIANTYIFALCGLIISKQVLIYAKMDNFIVLAILYVMVQCIRLVTLFMFSPILKRMGGGLTWQDSLICTWSGLRGAVGLALALIMFKTLEDHDKAIGDNILFHVSLIVMATLLINATTISHLMHFLGISDVSAVRKQSMATAIILLDQRLQKARNVWRVDRFLVSADWDIVSKVCAVEDPYRLTETMQEKESRERKNVTCPDCRHVIQYQLTKSEIQQKREEAISKFVKLLQRSYWRQFEKGLLMGTSLRKLLDMAETISHIEMEFLNIKQFRELWRSRPWMVTLVSCTRWNSVTFPIRVIEEHNRCGQARRAYYRFCGHWMLLLIIFGSEATVNLAMIIFCFFETQSEVFYIGLNHSSLILMCFTSLFFIFRMIVFGMRFLRTPWFILSIVFLLLFSIDVFSTFAYPDAGTDCQINEVFRILRSIQLMEVIFLLFHRQLDLSMHWKIKMACDVGRGFVRAHENALRMIANISDQESIRFTIKYESENAKLSMMRELGILQGFHPDIAVLVKTCHAIRAVLNVMREGMRQLMEEGGVDEVEGNCFIEVIESEMKHLIVSPPTPSVQSVQKILVNIPWIGKNESLIDFIQSRVQHLTFDYGTTIIRAGEDSDGVYFIISGLTKLVTTGAVTSYMHTQYLSAGNVVGEISTLMGMKRAFNLSCETIVKVLFLSKKDFFEAITTFHHQDRPLSKYLWRISALRMALGVLYSVPNYKVYNRETLLTRIENCTHHYLKNTTKFQVTPAMKDIILIIGSAVGSNGKTYEGPCYIPAGVNWLEFQPDKKPVPLLLYNDNNQVVARRRSSCKGEMLRLDRTSSALSDLRIPDF